MNWIEIEYSHFVLRKWRWYIIIFANFSKHKFCFVIWNYFCMRCYMRYCKRYLKNIFKANLKMNVIFNITLLLIYKHFLPWIFIKYKEICEIWFGLFCMTWLLYDSSQCHLRWLSFRRQCHADPLIYWDLNESVICGIHTWCCVYRLITRISNFLKWSIAAWNCFYTCFTWFLEFSYRLSLT